jgi:hypothetical protein
MDWENNEVRRFAVPRQGWHANISFVRPAAELVLEVMPVCNKSGAGVQCKKSIEVINVRA